MKKYRRPGRVKPALYIPWAGVQKLIAPAQVSRKTIPEPIPAVTLISELAAPPPAQEPEPDPAANRFALECWLNQHRPSLLAAIRRAEEECESAWFWAEAGFPAKLAAAEAALEAAVEAGREAMREALAEDGKPGPEEAPRPEAQDPGRELAFEEMEQMFGGFSKVWNLTDAQAARLEAVFREKGPVVVQSENKRWWNAEEWYL